MGVMWIGLQQAEWKGQKGSVLTAVGLRLGPRTKSVRGGGTRLRGHASPPAEADEQGWRRQVAGGTLLRLSILSESDQNVHRGTSSELGGYVLMQAPCKSSLS